MSGFLKTCWHLAETASDVYYFVGEKGVDKILQKTLHFLTSNSTWSATRWFLSEWNFDVPINSSFPKMERVLSNFAGLYSWSFLLSCKIFIYTCS